MVDLVVKRIELKETLSRILDLLMVKTKGGSSATIGGGNLKLLGAKPGSEKHSKPSGSTVAILKKKAVAKVTKQPANSVAKNAKPAKKSASQ
jgi:hypothetical protein